MSFKKCSQCGKTKSFEQFSKFAERKNGIRAYCKQCASLKQTEYNRKHREKIRAKAARHREANREKIKARKARYYKANREKIKAKTARYREANREKIRAKDARHREANREKIADVNLRRRLKKTFKATPLVETAMLIAQLKRKVRLNGKQRNHQ